jgi:hypothetical protein
MYDYHKDFSRVSKTMLNLFYDSAFEYAETYIFGRMETKKQTKQMDTGGLLHSILLEKKELKDLVLEYPSSCLKSNGDLNGKPAAQFRADNPGVICLKDTSEIQTAISAILKGLLKDWFAIVDHPGTHIEETIHFETPIPSRCKPDVFVDMGDHIICYDLKCTATFRPRDFLRTAKRFRYWLQDAHYSAGLIETFLKPVQFRFVVCEVVPPYRSQIRWYDERSREIARDSRLNKLMELSKRTESGNWIDDYSQELIVSPWDLGDTTEEELEGFDDTDTV